MDWIHGSLYIVSCEWKLQGLGDFLDIFSETFPFLIFQLYVHLERH